MPTTKVTIQWNVLSQKMNTKVPTAHGINPNVLPLKKEAIGQLFYLFLLFNSQLKN